MLEYLDIRKRGDMEDNSDSLHLAVEVSRGNSGDVNLGVEQIRECLAARVIHDRLDASAVGE